MSDKSRVYTNIKLNNDLEIKMNTFLSISDYLYLKEVSDNPNGKDRLEERLIEVFIFPVDKQKLPVPLSHELISYIAHELYTNQFINQHSFKLEEIYKLLIEKDLVGESIKKVNLKHFKFPPMQIPSGKANFIGKLQSLGLSIEKAESSLTSLARSFSGIAEELGKQLRSVGKNFFQFLDEIEIDEINNNFEKFYLYDKCFKEVNILVDDSLFLYIINNHNTIFEFIDSIPKEVNRKKKYVEQVFLEYWLYCIEENQKELIIEAGESKDESSTAFLRELKATMGNANYISAIMLLHIYLEKVMRDKLDEFLKEYQYEDFTKAMDIKLPEWLKDANSTTTFRYVLSKRVHVPLTSIQEKSIEAFDKYASLYFFTQALDIYDKSGEFRKRNQIIHFAKNMKYEKLDLMEMMKLFQLLKVILENEEITALLGEWSVKVSLKKQPLDEI